MMRWRNPLYTPSRSFTGLQAKFLGISLTNSSSISVATGIGVPTILTWDTENFSRSGAHSLTLNPSRIIVPFAGKWLVLVRVLWPADATGTIRRIRTIKSGVAQYADTIPAVALITFASLSIVLSLARNDYIEVDADHDATPSLSVVPQDFTTLFVSS